MMRFNSFDSLVSTIPRIHCYTGRITNIKSYMSIRDTMNDGISSINNVMIIVGQSKQSRTVSIVYEALSMFKQS